MENRREGRTWGAVPRALTGLWLSIAVALAGAGAAHAVQPDEVLKDPALESRARELSAELRCLVCQNQSIDESNAPLARDLRLLVRERLTAGDSDREIIDYIVARYGEFVLLRPPVGWHTLLLWLAPAVILLLGLFLVRQVWQSRRSIPAGPAPLSDADKARLKEIIARRQGRHE
jgi:cytochrome c-type biogenesis protein CcmH